MKNRLLPILITSLTTVMPYSVTLMADTGKNAVATINSSTETETSNSSSSTSISGKSTESSSAKTESVKSTEDNSSAQSDAGKSTDSGSTKTESSARSDSTTAATSTTKSDSSQSTNSNATAKTDTSTGTTAVTPTTSTTKSDSSQSTNSNATAKTDTSTGTTAVTPTTSTTKSDSSQSTNSNATAKTDTSTSTTAVTPTTSTTKSDSSQPTNSNVTAKTDTSTGTATTPVTSNNTTSAAKAETGTTTDIKSSTPNYAVSAPTYSINQPAANPVYIAPSTTSQDTATKTPQTGAVDTKDSTKDVPSTVFLAKNDSAKTCPNTPAIIDIGSNDEITGGSYRTTFQTNNGSTVTNNWDGWNGKDGTVTYIPGKDFRGADSFSYTIRDAKGNTSTATVAVDVSCDEPLFSGATSCDIYAISDDYTLMPVVVHRTQLLKIDQQSGQTNAIGNSSPPLEGIEGLAISPLTHNMYAVSGGYAGKALNGSLFRVSANTGETQLVGATGFTGTSSLAFRNDGTLWAWSEQGLINISADTGQGFLVYPSDKDFEGIAWSSDGKTLYATKFAGLWAYDGGEVKRICNNFPDEVEALETLSNGLLMYSLNQQHISSDSNALYVYDPQQCKVVSSIPIGGYRDIESVAWAYDCQPQLTSSVSGTVKFEGDAETQMCLKPNQWLDVKGTVSVQPATASAQLQTSWQVIEPPNPTCPTGDCTQAQIKSQMVTGSDTAFYIKGWWEGLKNSSSVKLRYTAKLLDMQGQALANTPEVNKTLVATPEACGKSTNTLPSGSVGQAAVDANALQNYFKSMGLKQFSLDDHGNLSISIDGKTHHGMFSYVVDQGSATPDQKLSLSAIPDVNADGVDDFVVIYPNGQTQLLLYLGSQ